jgi:hypothetical protein
VTALVAAQVIFARTEKLTGAAPVARCSTARNRGKSWEICNMTRTHERLYRVTLVDPITLAEVRDLGYFRESFAREFVEAYQHKTATDPDQVLIAQAVLIGRLLTATA